MPKIAQHQSAETVKMLLIGNSGAGKSGALCALAAAGYNVRMLDYDNGADVVRALLMDPKSPYPKDAAQRFDYFSLVEPRKNVAGKLIPQRSEAWTKTAAMLEKWTEGKAGEPGFVDYGPITSWTPKDVLVFDSLTTLSRAALRFVLQMNGRLGQKPWESDWGEGQDLIRSLFEMVTDPSVKCNVVFVCHYKYVDVQGQTKAYPNTLGKALPPEVGIYFNNALQVELAGIGTNAKRRLKTVPTGVLDLKTSNPHNTKADYPIETGLADFFRDVKGQGQPAAAQPHAVPAVASPPQGKPIAGTA